MFLRSALAQSARCPCCARLRPHSGTHGRPSGLFPCGFVRTRSAGSRLRFKIRVTDKMSRGSTSAAEAVFSFGQRVRLPCFIFLNHQCSLRFSFSRWGLQLSHLCFKKTSPSFPRPRRSRFFEGEVMWSKLYRSHKTLSSLQLQKNDASPRADFRSENKTFLGRAKHKTNALRTLRLWLAPCLSGASSAQLRSTMSGYFT